MRQNKIQKEKNKPEKTGQPNEKKWYWRIFAQFGVGCVLFFAVNVPVLAAGNVDTSSDHKWI